MSTAAPAAPRIATPSAQTAAERVNLRALAALVVPLGALWILIRHFTIESAAFGDLAGLAVAGFVVHYFLPLRFRLPFFLALSVAGIVLVLGMRQAVWLLAIGLGLIGICHLPVRWAARIALMLAVALVLTWLRAGGMPTPVPASVWPILGSMFMFRLVVYIYDLRHEPQLASLSASLSYFFLLPNVCFPLFPVVDFKGFRRTYYNADRHAIYQGGLQWMFRGVIQLLLYRVVYKTLVLDPAQVETAADLVQHLTWPFLLYLRVSGQFHLIVGMLKLFGFNLPETHHGYYLASSFTDFWRRINIYWKDFMMKLFYYPAFFALRKRGQAFALVVSTILVFAATWLLHSYQWFWLRGVFMFTWNDGIFWAVLGLLVIVNALREWRRSQTHSLSDRTLAWPATLRLAARTVLMFCTITLLWSLWSTESIGAWLSLWTAATVWPESVRWTAVVCMAIPFAIGLTMIAQARRWNGPRLGAAGHGALVVGAAACLVLASSFRVSAHLGPVGQAMLALRMTGLNQADAVAMERGYYENLLAVDRFNGELAALYQNRPLDWGEGLLEEGLAQPDPRGILPWALLPGVEGRFRGATLKTNAAGLHDKDYAPMPPAGCFRIAVLGASHAMGSGVPREQTFEARLEDRLNRERGGCYEVINFAVYGYSPLVQVDVLERKVRPFHPHALLYVGHPEDSARVIRFVSGRVTGRLPLPYDDLQTVINAAGVSADLADRIVVQRLEGFGSEILANLYRRLKRDARADGMCTGFVFLPMIPEMRYATDVVREKSIAVEAGFTLLDLTGVYDVPNRNALWVAEWDAHPNSEGHRLVADRLFAELTARPALLRACGNE